MKDQNKTKTQLIEELAMLRQKVAKLETDCAAKIDLAEHQKIVDELQQSGERLRGLIEGSIQGILVHRDTKALFANQAYANILGYDSPDEILAMDSIVPLIAPYEQERLLGYHAARTEGETAPTDYEYDAIRKDGSIVSLHHLVTQVNWDGEPAVLATIVDITERKQAEKSLQESEERFRQLAVNSPDTIYIFNLSNNQMKFINHEETLGYTLAELQQPGSILNQVHPDDLTRVAAFWQELSTNQADTMQVIDYRVRHKAGHWEWVHNRIITLSYTAEGLPKEFLVILTLITEIKQTEEELRRSVGRLKQAQQLARIGIWEWDIASDKTTWSEEMFPMYGIKPEEFTGRGEDYLNFTHPDDRQIQRDNVQNAFEKAARSQVQSGELSQIIPDPQEFRIVRPDGSFCYVSGDAVTIVDEQGNPAQMLGILMDITEEKKREEALRFQKMLLECQSEASPDGILIVSNNREWLSFNKRFIEMWNIPDKMVESRSSAEALQSVLSQLAEPKQFLAEIEYLYQHPNEKSHDEIVLKDGRVFDRHSSPVNNENGENYGRVWYYRDITRHKQAEIDIQKQHTLNKAILDAIMAHVVVLDQDGVIIATNESWTRFARDNGDPELQHTDIGQNYLEVCRRATGRDIEDVWAVLAGLEMVINEEATQFSMEYTCHSIDEQRWFLLHCSPLPAKIGGAVVVHTNITELKQAEEKLRESEARYKMLFESMPIPIFTKDRDSRYTSVNAENMKYWAHNPVGHTDAELLPPEMASELRAADLQVLETGQQLIVEEHIPTPHGIHHVLSYKVPLRDTDGHNIIGILGGSIDITERKHAEDTLRQQEEELRRRNQELTLLNEIIAASAAGLEPEDFLEPVCRELALVINVPQVAVALLNQEKTALTIVTEYRVEGRSPALHRIIPIKGNPTARYVYGHKTPLVIDKAQSDPRLALLHDLMEQRGTASLLIVPLIIADEVIGSLSFETTEARVFSSDDINLAWSVAGQVAAALARSEDAKARRLLSAAIEQSADSIIITDTSGDILYVNPAFEKNTGYSRAEVIGQNPRLLKSGRQGITFYRELWATISAGEVWYGRFVNKKKDDTLFTDDTVIAPVHNENGDIVNYVALQRDITRVLQLEEQLRQSQKMEAIGRLAGGVAHDFNNLLTIILGHTELLATSYLNRDDPRLVDVNQIRKASERAALLTRQLLAFSRQQPTQVQRLNLNEVVTNLEEMLRRLLGENLNLIIGLAPDLGDTMADPNHLEQIIINLAVNARDAMPGGGQLTLKTANVKLDGVNRYPNLAPGLYIMLIITDTGLGMDEKTRSHIFEPFYTTKGPGKGTGLGLAIVYSIVEQSNGHIEVKSEVGQGTTFKIYLPQVEQATKMVSSARVSSPATRGNETVLLVEDEDGVRRVIRKYLERQGYTVLEASHADEALQICLQREQRLDLLITDVVMPDISGPELAGQLMQAYPDLKCLFISGYADEELKAHRLKYDEVLLLEKPFSSDTLAFKVREALKKLG